MIQKRFVDCDWVRGVGEGRKPGGFAWGDQLFGHPDVVRGGFRKELGPVGGFGSHDGFPIAEFRLSHNAVGVRGPEFFALREAFVYSFRGVVRSWVYQALDRGDRRERGAVASIAAMSVERSEENHWSSWLGEGGRGGEGQASFVAYP